MVKGEEFPKADIYQAVVVDQLIEQYASLSLPEQVHKWTEGEFVTSFPHMIKRVLSEEGQQKFSWQARACIFEGCVRALENLYGPNEGVTRDADEISVESSYTFSLDTESCAYGSHSGVGKRVNLSRIDLAGVVLLGMSLPSTGNEVPTREIVTDRTRSIYRAEEGIRYLLPQDSLAREWVKKHQLDLATGRNWDKTVADIIVHCPENIPSVNRDPKQRLPIEMSVSFGPDVYSQDAMEVFLDYAVELVTIAPISSRIVRELVTFTINVRQYPAEFLQRADVNAALMIILYATNQISAKEKTERRMEMTSLIRDYNEARRNINKFHGGEINFDEE